MFLAIDIGNSSITLGVFDNDVLIKTFRLKSDLNINQEGYEFLLKSSLAGYKIKACAIVSVVEELNQCFKKACDTVFALDSFLFSKACKLGLEIDLKEPEKIGADRLVNAYAASKLYSLPLIVVDIGTAITFDIVSKSNKFIGGVIMPGLNMQLKALKSNTSKLPLVDLAVSPSAIGDNTVNAILSGIVRGSACAIDGLINQCETELGERAVIIATGGQSHVLEKYMGRKFDFVNPALTLEGIKNLFYSSHVNLY